MGSGSHLAAAHGREAARGDVRFMEESGNAVVRLARFGGLIVGDESRNQEENHMGARCFGEFVGTAVLILLGDGVAANVLLKRSKAEGAGWLSIAAGWALHSPWCLACSRQSLAAVRMVISTRHSRSAWRSRREIFRSSGRSWWHRRWARSWARSWSGCTSCLIGVRPKMRM